MKNKTFFLGIIKIILTILKAETPAKDVNPMVGKKLDRNLELSEGNQARIINQEDTNDLKAIQMDALPEEVCREERRGL